MKNFKIWTGLSLILLAGICINAGNVKSSFCSWTDDQAISCKKDEFQCRNGEKCIQRQMFCNGRNDCSDGSDESYCSTGSPRTHHPPGVCPFAAELYRCHYTMKCIPDTWLCNGYSDCPNADDEENCALSVISEETKISTVSPLRNIRNWLDNQQSSTTSEKWGAQVEKLALIYYFTYPVLTVTDERTTINEMAQEISIQLLSKLSSKNIRDVSSTELASYINAFVVTCMDPRNFHGYDIVQELRTRVDQKNFTNPYVFLSLCNAGETITESDKVKLIEIFQNKRRTFWTDTQAVVVMALACASKQSGNEIDMETLDEMTMELKQRQYRNGTVENLQTTALVMQALISTNSERDPDNFDEAKALQEILRNQKPDGGFGDFIIPYFITPILTCRSLVDIKADHCEKRSNDEMSALDNFVKLKGPKIRVQYTLWIGNEKDLERTMALRVPENMSLYQIMEIAAEIDSRYKIEYTVKDRKPYINAISGLRESPLTGKFWFLYSIEDEKPTPLNKSPADVKPKDNDHYVMWYRRGTWTV